MARIELKNIAHTYASHASEDYEDYALSPIDHVWNDGGAYALLGPSGCGKTTLLNIISGLLKPSKGQIKFDNKDVTELSTKERNIAQVFQFPVIYDTMSVYDNLAFPLRNRGYGEEQVKKRVYQVAEMLELTSCIEQRSHGLTADKKQIISLGRGLVRENVSAILFDEPLTVIDSHVKSKIRHKIKQIHQELKLTLIYVTHDQNEALTFADQVVVMQQGKVLQLGTPQDLFEAPAHKFVGHFIGSPGMNFIPCEVKGEHALVDNEIIPLRPGFSNSIGKSNAKFEIGVRPEYLNIENCKKKGSVQVTIESVQELGSFNIVTVSLCGHQIKVKLPEEQDIPSANVFLEFTPELTNLYADGILVI